VTSTKAETIKCEFFKNRMLPAKRSSTQSYKYLQRKFTLGKCFKHSERQ